MDCERILRHPQQSFGQGVPTLNGLSGILYGFSAITMAINLVTQPSRSCASAYRIAARTAVTTVARKRSIRCYSETRIRNPCVRSRMESSHHIHRLQPAANEHSSLLINLSIDCSDSRDRGHWQAARQRLGAYARANISAGHEMSQTVAILTN